ncbi:MAG: aminoglycoside phosphotransferase (APT) family kinase protein [Planctomycetota bacterium]|jgi:aminoglycoside phosphotransferase (APT) family kinase protein
MNGLRNYQRDFELLAYAGEAQLCPPSTQQLLEWIQEHLSMPGQSAPNAAQWTYARWKPSQSVSALASVTLADGSQHLVGCKRFHTGEAKPTGARPRWSAPDAPLRPAAVVPGANAILSSLAGDRALDGLSQVLRKGHLARLLEAAGVFGEHTLKARSSCAQLLRYKPERRAIYAYVADLHRPAPKPRQRNLLLRVLPPANARENAHARNLLQSLSPKDAPWPRLLHHEDAHGLLIESWIDGQAPASDEFHSPDRLAGLLAQLHRVPLPQASARPAPRSEPSLADLEPLFAHDAELLELADLSQIAPAAERLTWVHGDLHPDQMLCQADCAPQLVDFDELGIGDPCRDLASWIADRLAAAPKLTWGEASGAWLDAYAKAGGEPCDEVHLARWVRYELTRRAAATLRRLERDARSRARRMLACAARLETELRR